MGWRVALAATLTFQAELEEDEFHMLWLIDRIVAPGSRRVWLLMSAALKSGCRIVDATPAEQALLDAHGFGS